MSSYRFSVAMTASAVLRVGLVTLFVHLPGCTPTTVLGPVAVQAPVKVIELKGRYEREYILGASDEVKVIIRNDDDKARTVVIGPDGAISLPIAGRVVAAGLSVEGLRKVLTERLAKRLVQPEVTVIPIKVREPQVYVLGQVKSPGAVPYRQAASALEAVAHAGDMSPAAAKRGVALIRLGKDGKIRVTLVEPVDEGQPGTYAALSALQLEPEDILFVPERPMSQISRAMTEFSSPFVAIANALQPFLTLRLLQSLDTSQ